MGGLAVMIRDNVTISRLQECPDHGTSLECPTRHHAWKLLLPLMAP
jgi:hypothetical protein